MGIPVGGDARPQAVGYLVAASVRKHSVIVP